MTEEQINRFWSKVQRGTSDECWMWLASKSDGYGRFYINGKNHQAHRVSFEMSQEPIPDGLVLDHKCRNRACVNPAHLKPVTPGQNVLLNSQGLAADNKAKMECVRGHAFTGHNLWIKPDGKRRCRLCDNAWLRAYRAQKKAERNV